MMGFHDSQIEAYDSPSYTSYHHEWSELHISILIAKLEMAPRRVRR